MFVVIQNLARWQVRTRARSWQWSIVALACIAAFSRAADIRPTDLDFFERKIRPILVDNCYACHSSGEKIKGGFNLESREDLLHGGEGGPVLIPGDPDKSRLIEAVRYRNHEFQMPPKNPLRTDQVRDLETWVKIGAPDPRTKSARTSAPARKIDVAAGRQFWAFRNRTQPEVPAVKNAAWIKNSIDAFILQKLESKSLTPAPPADRGTWIRRVTFDLIGLPPSPTETEAFLLDTSAEAYGRVVDRLLASQHYGERWGRHWLDLARYADSNGLDENVAFGNAWRYRDYVINAFNKNKPFDQFLTEQLAGDLLPISEDLSIQYERLTALGFLSLGPKVLAEPDKVKLEMDLIDEQIDTVGRVFMATTLGCARCHDHKFDPIPIEDYYAMAAVFKSTHTMDDLKTPAVVHEPLVAWPSDREARAAHEQRLASERAAVTNFLAQANQQLLASLATNTLPKDPEKHYPTNTVTELAQLRNRVKQLEVDLPELPSTLGVRDHTNIVAALPVHIRGSHLSLGQPVPRGVPQVMSHGTPPAFPAGQSGRLELARWLTHPDHPLTARVIVNRIWRWHFGQGLVGSTDNFGHLGERPSHPELLDWLAQRFVDDGWDMKALHRHILLSSTYQISTQPGLAQRAYPDSNPTDPENRLLSRFPVRRLDAEEIRDNLLSVAGTLDLRVGGKTLPLKNREYVFNHTSRDTITYESLRRAVYLPIIRNHLYELFQQFDFPDPAVPTGHRQATVVAPQALLMMNSELVTEAASKFAQVLLATRSDAERLEWAYMQAYGRRPSHFERDRANRFLSALTHTTSRPVAEAQREAWTTFCQTLMSANEFIYLN